ncbi:MAG: hypothetical protein E5W70_22030 [Mesorhizobium sp.]|nr:MAG: hypothetical protein E5W70_22030 [Mesorhizobium sp.]
MNASQGAIIPMCLVVVSIPPPGRSMGLRAPAVMRSTADRRAWDVKTPTGRSTIAIEPVLALSSLIMVRDAVRAGVGAARLPVSLVSHDLADGTLVHRGDLDRPDIALSGSRKRGRQRWITVDRVFR